MVSKKIEDETGEYSISHWSGFRLHVFKYSSTKDMDDFYIVSKDRLLQWVSELYEDIKLHHYDVFKNERETDYVNSALRDILRFIHGMTSAIGGKEVDVKVIDELLSRNVGNGYPIPRIDDFANLVIASLDEDENDILDLFSKEKHQARVKTVCYNCSGVGYLGKNIDKCKDCKGKGYVKRIVWQGRDSYAI